MRFTSWGRERQAIHTDELWSDLWPPLGGSGAVGGTACVKTKRPPAVLAVGIKRKGPSSVKLKGPVNPAATYSPGPVGQVPSAMRGLTSVFGKGTGMTPSR